MNALILPFEKRRAIHGKNPLPTDPLEAYRPQLEFWLCHLLDVVLDLSEISSLSIKWNNDTDSYICCKM